MPLTLWRSRGGVQPEKQSIALTHINHAFSSLTPEGDKRYSKQQQRIFVRTPSSQYTGRTTGTMHHLYSSKTYSFTVTIIITVTATGLRTLLVGLLVLVRSVCIVQVLVLPTTLV